MHYFSFRKNNLYCENFKVSALAKKFGTPLYVYSARTILEHFFKLEQAFSELKPLICYSVKANSNLSILKLLTARGAGLDIVSGGELYRAKRVGCPAKRIVYASVGKTEAEINQAIKYGILMFNVESLPELDRINRVCARLNIKADVALRFNPDINAPTHVYIATGNKETKFGMDDQTIKKVAAEVKAYPNLNLAGIHIHIGSQLTESAPFVKAIKKAKGLIAELESGGLFLQYLNIGGGLGIIYDQEKPQTAKDFASKILPLLKGLPLKLILEPGRFIVGNAGILVAKVVYVKDSGHKEFIIVDAAMNDLLRPSLYGAYHTIVPVNKPRLSSEARRAKEETTNHEPRKLADVVGPICESSDFLGKSRKIEAKEGDYLAVLGAGAYGFSMSSNYNSRPRPAEVLVKDNKACLIRNRETYPDLIAKESLIK